MDNQSDISTELDSPNGIAYVKLVNDEGTNPDFIYLKVNKSFLEIVGLSEEEVLDSNGREIHSAPFYKEYLDLVIEAALTNTKQGFVLVDKSKNLYLSITATGDENKNALIKIEDVSKEITTFLGGEKVVNFTPILFILTDFQGKILMVNDEWSSILGYSKDRLVGSNIKEFLHPDDVEFTMSSVRDLSEGSKNLNYVNRYRRKDGTYCHLEWRARSVNSFVFGAAKYISEQLAHQEEKQRQLELLNLIFDQTLTSMIIMALEKPIKLPVGADEKLYKNLIDNLKVVRVNDAFEQLYGVTRGQIIGKSVAFFMQYNKRPEGFINFNDFISQSRVIIEHEVTKTDGSCLWVRGNYASLYNSAKELTGLFGMQIDLTERKNGELALAKSERMYRLITENASDVIWVLSIEDLKFSYISPSVYGFLGYTAQQLIGKPFSTTLLKEDLPIVQEMVVKSAEKFKNGQLEEAVKPFEVRHVTKDNKIVWFEVTVSFSFNGESKVEAIGVGRDISGRKLYDKKIIHLSYHDQLTNLFNRRYLEENKENICQDPHLMPLSIVVCDVNGLKLTNDVFGHEKGDELLIAGSTLFTKILGKEDIAIRYGGDEFLLILPNKGEEEAAEVVKKLIEVSNEIKVEKVPLSVSYGIATTPRPLSSFSGLLKQAEDGMYRDKLINGSAFKKRVVDILINSFYEKGVHEQSHSQTVGFICREIGKAMNLDITTLDNLYLSGVLHDIGKITLEEEVLNKVGALDEHEKVAMMRHPEIGFNILRTIQGFGRVAEWVLMHHEQPDGKGYPQQLPDEEIPLESKIISVATAYATMTASTRRLQLQTHQEALREIEFYASSKFDERVVKVLSSMKIDRLLRREERRIQKEQKQSAD